MGHLGYINQALLEFPQGELSFVPYTVVMIGFGTYCLIIPI